MRTTVWLWPLITTLLCANQLVCASQRQYVDFSDWNGIGEDYLIEKRTKPSLSIVNPLDVLRQRLLLEIARRQMRENTKQVEINRAILKNVGKRSNSRDFLDFLRQVPVEPDSNNDLDDMNRDPNLNMRNDGEDDRNKDFYRILDNSNVDSQNQNNNQQHHPKIIQNNNNNNRNNNKDNNDDYQIRYLYSLHKNRFTNK